MRDVAEWIRGTFASGRETKEPPPGKAVLGALLHNVVAESANHGLSVVAHDTERWIDLRVVVSDAIETLEVDINERHHRLTTALPGALVWLRADPWRLEQVFVNLLTNASRYTDAGGELAVWVHTRDGQTVVGIRDSGIGIAPDALPRTYSICSVRQMQRLRVPNRGSHRSRIGAQSRGVARGKRDCGECRPQAGK